jgi:hypothetical protein
LSFDSREVNEATSQFLTTGRKLRAVTLKRISTFSWLSLAAKDLPPRYGDAVPSPRVIAGFLGDASERTHPGPSDVQSPSTGELIGFSRRVLEDIRLNT